MQIFSPTSSAARMALVYITIGALTVIWTCVWYIYMGNHPPETSRPYYWCTGFLVTGLAFLVIGLAVGQIGRSARKAEHPPQIDSPSVVASAPVVPTDVPVAAPARPATAVSPDSARGNGRGEPLRSVSGR